VVGQASDPAYVASLCLLGKAKKLHVLNEFLSDLTAHELPPW
jgi:hypothetical protein